MDEAKSYVGSNYALPKLSFINATNVAKGNDILLDNDAIDIIVDGSTVVTSTLADDEEVQEMMDTMDGVDVPFIEDDERFTEEDGTYTDEGNDDTGAIESGSVDTSEGSNHIEVRERASTYRDIFI